MIKNLATYQKFIEQAQQNWPNFLELRKTRLAKSNLNAVNERVTENILNDLFNKVLDWEINEIHQQIDYADIVLVNTSLTRAIIEAKRPGLLKWNQTEVEKALAQVRRYADQQKVKTIAISDGHMFYAADIEHGGLTERLYVDLDHPIFPEDLYWTSKHGIYRKRENYSSLLNAKTAILLNEDDLLHPKYKVPARCFAYIGDATDQKTWKLPYLLATGEVDTRRLSGAVRCIISNYRGTNVKGLPHEAIPNVLKRLGEAAHRAGKMPSQNPKTAETYIQLDAILKNL